MQLKHEYGVYFDICEKTESIITDIAISFTHLREMKRKTK